MYCDNIAEQVLKLAVKGLVLVIVRCMSARLSLARVAKLLHI